MRARVREEVSHRVVFICGSLTGVAITAAVVYVVGIVERVTALEQVMKLIVAALSQR